MYINNIHQYTSTYLHIHNYIASYAHGIHGVNTRKGQSPPLETFLSLAACLVVASRWPQFYVNSNCLIWHDPYVHRINSLNKSLVRMEPFCCLLLLCLRKDSEAVEIHAHHYVNMRLYCSISSREAAREHVTPPGNT